MTEDRIVPIPKRFTGELEEVADRIECKATIEPGFADIYFFNHGQDRRPSSAFDKHGSLAFGHYFHWSSITLVPEQAVICVLS